MSLRKKLLKTSNFSFCHNVFNLFSVIIPSFLGIFRILRRCFQSRQLQIWCIWERVNPFPHTDTFWRLCSRRLFENKVTKEEIAQDEQFLLLPQCLPLLVIGYPFNYRDFPFFDKNMFKVVCCRIVLWGKGLRWHLYVKCIG